MTEPYPNRLVWAEIPVADMSRAQKFYETLFDAPLNLIDEEPNPTAMFPYPGGTGAAGHLYPGTPAKRGEGITAHVAVSSGLDTAMDRVRDAGGEVVSEVITIPAGSFFYAIDTEGNSLGVFKV